MVDERCVRPCYRSPEYYVWSGSPVPAQVTPEIPTGLARNAVVLDFEAGVARPVGCSDAQVHVNVWGKRARTTINQGQREYERRQVANTAASSGAASGLSGERESETHHQVTNTSVVGDVNVHRKCARTDINQGQREYERHQVPNEAAGSAAVSGLSAFPAAVDCSLPLPSKYLISLCNNRSPSHFYNI